MPGEVEQRTRAQRLRDGIDLDATTWAQVVAAARSLGLDEGHGAAGACGFACGAGASPARARRTALASARTWSGVVPQQPPRRRAPASRNRRWISQIIFGCVSENRSPLLSRSFFESANRSPRMSASFIP